MRSSASLAGSRKLFQTAREGAGAAVSEPRGSGQSWPPVPRARERLPGLCLGSDECSKAVHPAGARPSLPTTLRRGQCSCDSLQGPPRPGPAWPTRLTTRHFPQTPELHPPCLPHAVAPPAGVHLTSPLVSYVGGCGHTNLPSLWSCRSSWEPRVPLMSQTPPRILGSSSVSTLGEWVPLGCGRCVFVPPRLPPGGRCLEA